MQTVYYLCNDSPEPDNLDGLVFNHSPREKIFLLEYPGYPTLDALVKWRGARKASEQGHLIIAEDNGKRRFLTKGENIRLGELACDRRNRPNTDDTDIDDIDIDHTVSFIDRAEDLETSPEVLEAIAKLAVFYMDETRSPMVSFRAVVAQSRADSCRCRKMSRKEERKAWEIWQTHTSFDVSAVHEKIVEQEGNPLETRWNGFEFGDMLPNDDLIRHNRKPAVDMVNRVSAWPSMMDTGPDF